jgi:hypothetical protein
MPAPQVVAGTENMYPLEEERWTMTLEDDAHKPVSWRTSTGVDLPNMSANDFPEFLRLLYNEGVQIREKLLAIDPMVLSRTLDSVPRSSTFLNHKGEEYHAEAELEHSEELKEVARSWLFKYLTGVDAQDKMQ